MWKEKYEALKVQYDELARVHDEMHRPGGLHDQLVQAHDALAVRLKALEGGSKKDSAAESRAGQPAADKTEWIPASKGHPSVASSNGDAFQQAEQFYRYFLNRILAEKEPVIVKLLAERPELRVTREIKTVQAHASTLKGALGILISEKFFDAARPFDDVRKEFIRRGFIAVKTPSRQIEGAIDSLVEMGFLTKEETGLLAVPGMKINIVEARG